MLLKCFESSWRVNFATLLSEVPRNDADGFSSCTDLKPFESSQTSPSTTNFRPFSKRPSPFVSLTFFIDSKLTPRPQAESNAKLADGRPSATWPSIDLQRGILDGAAIRYKSTCLRQAGWRGRRSSERPGVTHGIRKQNLHVLTLERRGHRRLGLLLPFKHEDVRLASACAVDGHRQGFAIGRKLDLPCARDLAVELVGYFQSAPVRPSCRGHKTRGHVRAHIWIILAIEFHSSPLCYCRLSTYKNLWRY